MKLFRHNSLRRLFTSVFILTCLLIQVRMVFACDVMDTRLSSCCCHEQAAMDCEKTGECQDVTADACCEIDLSISAGTSTVTGSYMQVIDGNTVSSEQPPPLLFLTQALFEIPPPQASLVIARPLQTDWSAGSNTYLKTLRLRI